MPMRLDMASFLSEASGQNAIFEIRTDLCMIDLAGMVG
jgi:hypothetical protein